MKQLKETPVLISLKNLSPSKPGRQAGAPILTFGTRGKEVVAFTPLPFTSGGGKKKPPVRTEWKGGLAQSTTEESGEEKGLMLIAGIEPRIVLHTLRIQVTVQETFPDLHCALCIVHCALCAVHCTLYTVHCTLYTQPRTSAALLVFRNQPPAGTYVHGDGY